MSNPISSTDVQINRTSILNNCKTLVNQIIANIPNKTLSSMICLQSLIVDKEFFKLYFSLGKVDTITFCYNSHNNPEITNYFCSLYNHNTNKNTLKIFITKNDIDIPIVNGKSYGLIFFDNYDQYKSISEIIMEKDKAIFFYNIYTDKIVYNEKGWNYVTGQ